MGKRTKTCPVCGRKAIKILRSENGNFQLDNNTVVRESTFYHSMVTEHCASPGAAGV